MIQWTHIPWEHEIAQSEYFCILNWASARLHHPLLELIFFKPNKTKEIYCKLLAQKLDKMIRYGDVKNSTLQYETIICRCSVLMHKLTLRKVLNGIFKPSFLQCFGAQTQVT